MPVVRCTTRGKDVGGSSIRGLLGADGAATCQVLSRLSG